MLTTIGSQNCLLGEGPVWNPQQQLLYWTDILNGTIFTYNPADGAINTVFRCDSSTGAFLFTENDDLVVFTEKGVLIANKRESGYALSEDCLLFSVNMRAGERFNDAIVDPVGRMIAGTNTNENMDGRLYSFCKGKGPKVLLDGLRITNGMGFSPDAKTFYHTDSLTYTITAYDYDSEEGNISNPRPFFTLDQSSGVPDGMTVDADGNVWVACWGGACVLHLSSAGKVIDTYHTPAMQTSSVCIGGKDMDTLFITSAAEGCTSITNPVDSLGRYLGGLLYMQPVQAKGRPEYRAHV